MSLYERLVLIGFCGVFGALASVAFRACTQPGERVREACVYMHGNPECVPAPAWEQRHAPAWEQRHKKSGQ